MPVRKLARRDLESLLEHGVSKLRNPHGIVVHVGLLRAISRPLLVAVVVDAIIGARILRLPGRAYAMLALTAVLVAGIRETGAVGDAVHGG